MTPALALSLAWLFFTAFQRPWYDVMAISLLALYSASLLDWVVLIRLLAGATIYAQAVQSPAEPHWLYDVGQFNGTWLTPGVRLRRGGAGLAVRFRPLGLALPAGGARRPVARAAAGDLTGFSTGTRCG